ncbi:MAG: hypothetical protein WAK58_21940, partial [Trebonia sp.]
GTGRLIEAPVVASDGLATDVVRSLDAAGVKVREISVRSASLDDVFLTLTGRSLRDDSPGGGDAVGAAAELAGAGAGTGSKE